MIALLRKAGYDEPIYLHGALESITHYYQSRGIGLGKLQPVRSAERAALAGVIALCPPSALHEPWSRRFPDPVRAFASGWIGLVLLAVVRVVTKPTSVHCPRLAKSPQG